MPIKPIPIVPTTVHELHVGLLLTFGLFGAAVYGFGQIEQNFFPPATRPQFMVDTFLPAGSHIRESEGFADAVGRYIQAQSDLTHVTSFIDGGGLRFLLVYSPERENRAYIQFGFMALLGVIGLAGEQIKNAVVLVDEVNTKLGENKSPYEALVDASVSRLRPVLLVAVTTVLGMIPLLRDAFFSAMAATMMFGLAFACVLTMIVVPILYAIFFRIDEPANAPSGA